VCIQTACSTAFPSVSRQKLVRLIDSEKRRRLALREPPSLNLIDDLCGQLGFRQKIVCLWKVQVRKHVSTTRHVVSNRRRSISFFTGQLARNLEPLPDQI
jgi:hypothetical protein